MDVDFVVGIDFDYQYPVSGCGSTLICVDFGKHSSTWSTNREAHVSNDDWLKVEQKMKACFTPSQPNSSGRSSTFCRKQNAKLSFRCIHVIDDSRSVNQVTAEFREPKAVDAAQVKSADRGLSSATHCSLRFLKWRREDCTLHRNPTK